MKSSILVGLSFSFFLILPAQANENSTCATNISWSLNSIDFIARTLIEKHKEFHILKDVDLRVEYTGNDGSTFFRTFFSVFGKLVPFVEPHYLIYANKDINICPPTLSAVEAIIAHELFHIVDYVRKGRIDLIKLGFDYGPEYERDADIRAIGLGYGIGLIHYRVWIYSVLKTEAQIEKKRRYYLTPEEIVERMNSIPID